MTGGQGQRCRGKRWRGGSKIEVVKMRGGVRGGEGRREAKGGKREIRKEKIEKEIKEKEKGKRREEKRGKKKREKRKINKREKDKKTRM